MCFFFLSNSGSCSGFCYVDHCLGQEKGSTPLHVAAKAGQVSQVELLTVYGADPGAPDSRGKTPIDCARQAYVFIMSNNYLYIRQNIKLNLTF